MAVIILQILLTSSKRSNSIWPASSILLTPWLCHPLITKTVTTPATPMVNQMQWCQQLQRKQTWPLLTIHPSPFVSTYLLSKPQNASLPSASCVVSADNATLMSVCLFNNLHGWWQQCPNATMHISNHTHECLTPCKQFTLPTHLEWLTMAQASQSIDKILPTQLDHPHNQLQPICKPTCTTPP